jgi:hypothetical protein
MADHCLTCSASNDFASKRREQLSATQLGQLMPLHLIGRFAVTSVDRALAAPMNVASAGIVGGLPGLAIELDA